METLALQNMLIAILRSELNGTELACAVKEQLSPTVIADLFAFSKHHDLVHVVGASLRKAGVLPAEWATKFQKEEFTAVYRNEQMKHTYSEICAVLEEQKIPYIPLKGAVMRPHYPDETMRTSCDIDILIPQENTDKAVAALSAKGYAVGEKAYHDVSLFSPSNIHLELHFSLCENKPALDKILGNAWQYATPQNGMQHAFSNAFLVFHLFAHTAYHFLEGGCGIRPLMDIWVMEHRMGVSFEEAQSLLEKANIARFAAEMHALAEVLFSGKPGGAFEQSLLDYILEGGLYGSIHNRLAVDKSSTGNVAGLALQKLFLPYRSMVLRYPVLKKAPILLPFFWIARCLKAVFGKANPTTLNDLHVASSLSDEQVNAIKHLRKRLEL